MTGFFSGPRDPAYQLGRQPVLDEGAEHDVLNGGLGSDWMFAGYGDDVDGGAGLDMVAIGFQGASAGVTADFSALVRGEAITVGGGIIANIEQVRWVEGSEFGDNLTLSTAGSYSATVLGMGGDDILISNQLDLVYGNILYGGTGNDIIRGGISAFGEDGDDQIWANTASGGAGNDMVQLLDDRNEASLSGDGGDDELLGGQANDILIGGLGADMLHGGAGDDILYSAERDGTDAQVDHLFGGEGSDIIYMGVGDVADGGAGQDRIDIDLRAMNQGVTIDFAAAIDGDIGIGIVRNFENLRITGSDHADVFRVGDFSANISAGDGDDLVAATGAGRLNFNGGAGQDRLEGGSGDDGLSGDAGDDWLIGGMGADQLRGGDGDDLIEGGGGDDLIDGGAGVDTVSYANAPGAVVVNLSVNGYNATGIDGQDRIVNVENVIGSGFDDVIIGGSAANRLEGGDGNDRLEGRGGTDILIGGAGADVMIGGGNADMMIGGQGNDSYYVDHVGDQIAEGPDGGYDSVFASVDFWLGDFIDALWLQGDLDLSGHGNALANLLQGNDGDNILDGLEGEDRLVGAGGDDVLNGGAGDDLLEPGTGNDTVDGGAGFDTLLLAGAERSYSLISADGWTWLVGEKGATRMVDVEQVAFADGMLATGDLAGSLSVFDGLRYAAGYADLIAAFSIDAAAATEHYVTAGFAEGRDAMAFDPLAYIAGYADLIIAFGVDAAAATQHYVLAGFAEGRSDDLFDGLQYLASYADLSAAFGTDADAAARHYILAGRAEGRSADTFDGLRYIASNPDLIVALGSDDDAAARDYIETGRAAGRDVDGFDALAYAAANPDLAAAFGSDVEALTEHYIDAGYYEHRVLTPSADMFVAG